MATVSLGYRTDLMLLGLQGSVIEQRAGYQVVRTPTNPTFYWGNFLVLGGPPAPGTVSSWISTFAREFPGAEHVALGVDSTDGAAGDQPELAAAGLAVERNTVLAAGTTDPPPHPNETAQFRMLDRDADWLAALELQEAVYPDGEPEGWEHGLRARRVQRRKRDRPVPGRGHPPGPSQPGPGRNAGVPGRPACAEGDGRTDARHCRGTSRPGDQDLPLGRLPRCRDRGAAPAPAAQLERCAPSLSCLPFQTLKQLHNGCRVQPGYQDAGHRRHLSLAAPNGMPGCR